MKKYINDAQLKSLSVQLTDKILESKFQPTFLVALWRGGAQIGTQVQEMLDRAGCPTNHIAIRTSRYIDPNTTRKEVNVYSINYIIETANATDRLIIIDDIFDSGLTIEAVIRDLKLKMRLNCPVIKTACVWYKPTKRVVDFTPDFYCEETDKWIVLPHELEGMTLEEIEEHKGKEVSDMLRKYVDK